MQRPQHAYGNARGIHTVHALRFHIRSQVAVAAQLDDVFCLSGKINWRFPETVWTFIRQAIFFFAGNHAGFASDAFGCIIKHADSIV